MAGQLRRLGCWVAVLAGFCGRWGKAGAALKRPEAGGKQRRRNNVKLQRNGAGLEGEKAMGGPRGGLR